MFGIWNFSFTVNMLLSNLFLHTLHFRNLRALTARRLLSFGLDHPNKCCVSSIRMESSSNCNLRASSSESRGALIVLEGLDRSGKTSQSSRLLSYLEGLGHSTELWRFPDRSTSVGQMISAYLSNKSHLDDRTIHLLFSANRWEKRYVLLSWIAYIYENLSWPLALVLFFFFLGGGG